MPTALIATAKGLVVYDFPDNKKPELRGLHFVGFSVNMVYVDERHDRWWAGVSHKHWGQKLHYSDDFGQSWQETSLPSYKGKELPDGNQAKLKQIWCMSHGGADKPDVLWLGTEPGGLFKSEDGGATFQLCRPLWEHPSRQRQEQWFGAGSDHPFIHSIEIDPRNSEHLYIAVSCAGVFKTTDGGASWDARNNGLVATYLPNPNVEVGHDPHRLMISPADPDTLWQQNHCGIFYTRDQGLQWHDVSIQDGIPYYGFALAIDEKDPAKAWVMPVESDEQRIAPGLRLQVFKTEDFGKTWLPDSDGLPFENCFDIALRQSFAKRGDLFIFGTTNGNLYYRNEGSSNWELLNHSLTKVNSVVLL